jgi:hypothetical protein
MASHRLGPFYEGFASARRMLSGARAEAVPIVFANTCVEVAGYVGRGLDRIVAIDELKQIAEAYGLFDDDDVQRMIAAAFAKVPRTNGPEQQENIAPPPGDFIIDRSSNDWWDSQAMVARWEKGDRPQDKGKGDRQGQPDKIIPQTSKGFMQLLTPPDFVLDGILQRRFLYSLTGKTGSGKTAVALYIAACVALGRSIGDLEVQQGRVLYLAGENPDDVRYRWCAMGQQMDFDCDNIDVLFLPRFSLSKTSIDLSTIGELLLVVVDTSPAYYEGDDVNSNTQLGDHARMLRRLIELPGQPCVLALCHPNKKGDELEPYGAGAFINEVDGNLTISGDIGGVELHWHKKIRGHDFAAVPFELASVTHERLVTSTGKMFRTVIARHLSKDAQEGMEKAVRGQAEQVLADLATNPKATQRERANRLGWTLKDGLKPDNPKIGRLFRMLKKEHLAEQKMGKWMITDKGKKYLLQECSKTR